MDCGYFADVGSQSITLGSAAVGLPDECAGYVICDRLKRPAVAIVVMNSRSLQAPLL